MKTFFIVLLVFFSSIIFAQDTQLVVTTGFGQEKDSALKNAFHGAVEQVVSSLVDPDVLVKNDETITELISNSDVFVEQWHQIGDLKKSNGGIAVKIQATIFREKLIKSLLNAKIELKSDTTNVFGEELIAIEKQASAQKLFEEVCNGFPEKFLIAEVEKPKIVRAGNPNSVSLGLTVKYDTAAYFKTFLPNLLQVLNKIAIKSGGADLMMNGQVSPEGTISNLNDWDVCGEFVDYGVANGKQTALWVNTHQNATGSYLKWKWFILEPSLFAFLESVLAQKSVRLQIFYLDSNGQEIRANEVEVLAQNKSFREFSVHPFGRYLNGRVFHLCPFFVLPDDLMEYTTSLPLKIETTFTQSELKQIHSIKCSFVPAKWKYSH